MSWWREGRKATRAEIDAAIAKGMPKLHQAAAMQGPDSIKELQRYLERAEKLLPAE